MIYVSKQEKMLPYLAWPPFLLAPSLSGPVIFWLQCWQRMRWRWRALKGRLLMRSRSTRTASSCGWGHFSDSFARSPGRRGGASGLGWTSPCTPCPKNRGRRNHGLLCSRHSSTPQDYLSTKNVMFLKPCILDVLIEWKFIDKTYGGWIFLRVLARDWPVLDTGRVWGCVCPRLKVVWPHWYRNLARWASETTRKGPNGRNPFYGTRPSTNRRLPDVHLEEEKRLLRVKTTNWKKILWKIWLK